MSYSDVLARSQKLDADGVPVFPLRRPSIDGPARGMSAQCGETEGLAPEAASPVPARHAPDLFTRFWSMFL